MSKAGFRVSIQKAQVLLVDKGASAPHIDTHVDRPWPRSRRHGLAWQPERDNS